MFLTFFANLRQPDVPVTPRENLDLVRALEGDLAEKSVDEFYRLSRALLVKDQRNLDKFDIVFASTFKGVLTVAAAVDAGELPEKWLRRLFERYLSPAERAGIEKLGLDKLMETLRRRRLAGQGAPSGRVEVDRDRRNLAVRRLRRPSRGGADRPGRRLPPAAPSRSGTGASSRISTATPSSGRATSSWRCGVCAGSRARSRPKSSTLTARSVRAPTRAKST